VKCAAADIRHPTQHVPVRGRAFSPPHLAYPNMRVGTPKPDPLQKWGEAMIDINKGDLKQYRHRVDSSFERVPNVPEKWGEPEYKPRPFSLNV
jgi:hypothetical protein